jgi:hypothetical protein
MLGDIVELSVVVRDLDATVEPFTKLFGVEPLFRASVDAGEVVPLGAGPGPS